MSGATNPAGDVRYQILLDSEADVAGWREKARRLLMEGVHPDRLVWDVRNQAEARLDLGEGGNLPIIHADGGAPKVRIAKPLLKTIETALLHSASERFALAYRIVWRAQRERHLHRNPADTDIRRLEALAKSVRRDIHKMHAFVRFRKIGNSEEGRERFVAWFEPDHHIVAAVAPFFRNRFTGMDWLIVTPRASIAWDGGQLSHGPGGNRADVPQSDAIDEEWRTYYANIFNPARVKINAMKAEMPVKYWKNLPEAQLIKPLVAEANARVEQMVAAGAESEMPDLTDKAETGGRFETLEQLYAALASDRGAPREDFASQIVPGKGPPNAPLLIVGEQPGDEEDRQGRPFVGPAGQLLNRAMGEVGLARDHAFVTNAVKRFKYQLRGKRRIHQSPSVGDITHYRWWLEQEIALVQPRLILALGASAARAVIGKAVTVSRVRGQFVQLGQRCSLLVTVHPSYLLRLPDEEGQRIEREKFLRDLRVAKQFLDVA